MDTKMLDAKIEDLYRKIEQGGMRCMVLCSREVEHEHKRLMRFAADHKRVVESVYGPGGHGVLANQTPAEVADDMASGKLPTWIAYNLDTEQPIANASLQRTSFLAPGDNLAWDIARMTKNPSWPNFPGSLPTLVALRWLLGSTQRQATTLALSGELRTGVCVTIDGLFVPGGPQSLLVNMRYGGMIPFGFEPLIATGLGIVGRKPLVEFFQISYRFWDASTVKWNRPFFLDPENVLLGKLVEGVFQANGIQSCTQSGAETTGLPKVEVEIVADGQFAQVKLGGNVTTDMIRETASHLFETVRFIRFVVPNAAENISVQRTLRLCGALPTVFRPTLETNVQTGKKIMIDFPGEFWFGMMRPGTQGFLIPFALSPLHDEPRFKTISRFANDLHARFRNPAD